MTPASRAAIYRRNAAKARKIAAKQHKEIAKLAELKGVSYTQARRLYKQSATQHSTPKKQEGNGTMSTHTTKHADVSKAGFVAGVILNDIIETSVRNGVTPHDVVGVLHNYFKGVR